MAAAALAKFRSKIFDNHVDLTKFVNQNDSVVNTITAIISDGNGKLILFYMIA